MLSGLLGPLGVVETAAYAPGAVERIGSGVSEVAKKADKAVRSSRSGPNSIKRWWDSLTPKQKAQYRNLGIGGAVLGGGLLAYEHYRSTQPAIAASTTATGTSAATTYPGTSYYQGTSYAGSTAYTSTAYTTSTSYVPTTTSYVGTTTTVPVGPPPQQLKIRSLALGEPIVGRPYMEQFTATGGTPPLAWSGQVTAPGLSINQYGQITGTPTRAGRYSGYVTVTDSTTPQPMKATRTFTFTVRAASGASTTAPPITIPVQPFPAARVGQPFNATLRADGGTPPDQWSGQAAPGLVVQSDGLITGTPTQAGRFPGDIMVTDSRGKDATRTFVQTVEKAATTSASGSGSASAPSTPAPSIPTISGVKALTVGEPFFVQVPVHNGEPPYRWSASGVPGLSITSGGVLHGSPTRAGRYTEVVRVTDKAGRTAGRTFILSVQAAPATHPAAVNTQTHTTSTKASATHTATTTKVTSSVPASVANAARVAAARQSALAAQQQAAAQAAARKEAAAAAAAAQAAARAQAERTAAAQAAAQRAGQQAAAARAAALAREQEQVLTQQPIRYNTPLPSTVANAARTTAARTSASSARSSVAANKKKAAVKKSTTTLGSNVRFGAI